MKDFFFFLIDSDNYGLLSNCLCVFAHKGLLLNKQSVVSALMKIMEANMDIIYKDMVTKMQQVALLGLVSR